MVEIIHIEEEKEQYLKVDIKYDHLFMMVAKALNQVSMMVCFIQWIGYQQF